MFVSEIFALKDAIKYHNGAYTSPQELPISFTGDFKATFKVKKTGTSQTGAYILIGASSSDNVFCGQGGSNMLSLFLINNWSGVNCNMPQNQYSTVTLTYNNGSWSATCNNVNTTLSKTYNSFEYCKLQIESNNSITDLLIEPL